MRHHWSMVLGFLGISLVSGPAFAAVEFFGTAKIKPTFYKDLDFDDSKSDAPTLNEGGWTSGAHTRGELRLGWKAEGDRWKVKMIAEADVILEKDTADRSFYVGAAKEDQPNTGGEFGIERAELLYAFDPALELEAGWDIRALDIGSGGLLYGDDHPFIGFRGTVPTGGLGLKYELLYLPIQNRDKVGVQDNWKTGDWSVYSAKVGASFDTGLGKVTVSPLYAYSDNEDKKANIHYYGLEALGQLGPVRPALEVVAANGEFKGTSKDIGALAAFAGAEVLVDKAFKPYAAYRFTSGDGDKADDDVEGFVGITDIGRFTPLMGMDGNVLGEHLASGASIYNSPLYSFSPERAVGGNAYGGIGNASSGNNPGQQLLAVGASGDLGAFVPSLTYKTQAFFIWYDETANLVNKKTPGAKVDSYAGTTFDLQLLYSFSKNFAVDYIFSTFVPGAGIEDQVDAKDPAFVNMLTLAWTY